MLQNVPYTTAGASPACAAPARLSGRAFAALSADEFACPPEIVNSAPRYVEAEAGERRAHRDAVSLSCWFGDCFCGSLYPSMYAVIYSGSNIHRSSHLTNMTD